MLDPVSGISLAAAVIDLAGFGVKLLSRGKAFHESIDGLPIDHTKMKAAAENLSSLTSNLGRDLDTLKWTSPSSSVQALIATAKEAQAVAVELSVAMNRLKASDQRSKWNSFSQAIKSLWKEDQINQLLARFERTRERVVLNLLVLMR